MFRIISTKKLQEMSERSDIWKEAVEKKMAAEDRASAAERELEAIRAKAKPTLYCSFCGKSQHDVKKLIAGPSTFICDECVNLCIEIVNETTRAEADLQLVYEAIEAHWGERCSDANPECNTCRAWAYIDKLSGRSAAQKEARAAK